MKMRKESARRGGAWEGGKTRLIRGIAYGLSGGLLAACPPAGVASLGQAGVIGPRAGAVPDYDFDWATIGDPGNRGVLSEEAPLDVNVRGRGSVGYAYRMATTEVTTGQWLEFVNAYSPYFDRTKEQEAFFASQNIGFDPLLGRWTLIAGTENVPAKGMSWRFAARYVNWLNNSKAITRDAFETGAYDTSTFTKNADFTLNDQSTRSPGSQFWIPSLDEWIKAVYYDPDKNGPGDSGYWLYPNASDEPLVSGLPGEPGAQTSADLTFFAKLDVGSYPDVSAPWGLFDTSGGVAEWTEELNLSGSRHISKGTSTAMGDSFLFDRLDATISGSDGLRLASVVPEPHTITIALLCIISCTGRRRRMR